MDNSSESPEKASKKSHNSNLVVEDREHLAAISPIAANLETLMGEWVSPKSTLKHLFGTGKDSQVSLKGEVLFKDIGLTGVGCRRNYMDVRISAVDMFVIQCGVTERR